MEVGKQGRREAGTTDGGREPADGLSRLRPRPSSLPRLLTSLLPRFHASSLPTYYGWLIVASSFLILGVAYTVWYSFSVFFVAILGDYGWSRALTAGVYSVFVLVHGAVGPISGGLIDRKGPRLVVSLGALVLVAGLLGCSQMTEPWQFYLSYSLIVAVGVSSIGWVPNVVLLSNWFVRRLGMAVGIASGGIGVGILIMVPLAQYLISQVGWRFTYLVLAATALAVIIPTSLLFQRRRPQDMGLLPDGDGPTAQQDRTGRHSLMVDRSWAERVWTVRAAVGTKRFWLAFVCALLLSFATQMVMVHQVALLVDAGYGKMAAAAAVGAVGMASVAGRFSWGTLSDRIGREVAFSLGMVCTVVAISLLILARGAPIWWLPYFYGVWMGFGYAVLATMMPTVGADLFRGKSFGSIFGLITMGSAMGGAFGSWQAGYIFDHTGDYLPALQMGIVAMFACMVLLWLIAPRKVRLVPGQAAQMAARSAGKPS